MFLRITAEKWWLLPKLATLLHQQIKKLLFCTNNTKNVIIARFFVKQARR